jgi:periplasmic protein TonB
MAALLDLRTLATLLCASLLLRGAGIEGYVLLQFTIDELGRVVNPSGIEAQPRGVFDGAGLKAVERFKYKPRVVDGRAVPVTGVQHLLTFNLSG